MNEKPLIGIAGFGQEGRAAYGYFKDAATIHVFDENPIDELPPDIVFHTGLVIPASIPIIYKSPGIPSRKLVLESPSTRVSTLMDVLLEKIRDRAVGVTGTKGKSTVASLIAHVLKEAGRDTVLCGNIGMNDTALFSQDTDDRLYVFELSSYQCEYLTVSPHIAVLTNLYEEHLPHHGSFEAYREAKLNIARFQSPEDIFINGSGIETHFAGKMLSPDVIQPFETKLLGTHNQKNCALSLAALLSLGLSEEEVRRHIASFEPLPYRLENVGSYNGITFYDDSLATVPEATLASIEALPRVDTLILGGEDRHISFYEFARKLAKTSINTFITFPETGSKMVTGVADRRVIPVSSMEEAVRAAFEHTAPGGIVLLSNASPSFNLFKDYKDKSAQYRRWLRGIGVR